MKTSFVLLIFLSLISCSFPTNYKDAYLVKVNDTVLLKVKGERRLMVHDFISMFTDNLYEDSCLIPIMRNCNDCVIYGKDIPIEEGHYKFLGQIKIENKTADVQLQYNNTDDKCLESFGWNGRYVLNNRLK
jgi:hypothetical protein